MHSQAEIRDARPEDSANLAGLLGALGYEASAAEVGRRLLALGQDDRVLLTGDASGLVALHRVPRLAEGGSFARITALVVAPQSRGRGIGRVLLEAAEAVALEWGCELLEVSSSRRPERAAAHALYLASGFYDAAPEAVRYRKPLG